MIRSADVIGHKSLLGFIEVFKILADRIENIVGHISPGPKITTKMEIQKSYDNDKVATRVY